MNAEESQEFPLPLGPEEIRRRFQELRWQERTLAKQLEEGQKKMAEIGAFLTRAPQIADRVDQLSQQMFGDILDEVERNLTYALREILEQDLKVITTREVKKGKVNITFGIERQGEREDILTGQGGSVCNIISVGLRLIALSQLHEKEHRRFLILDEQDCWLRPDLVPRLMHIIHTIAQRLQFQILVISHHDVNLFREYADCIYRLLPPAREGEAVQAELIEVSD
jgi:ABC-type branched-subunit amino acid transport system ATPase component